MADLQPPLEAPINGPSSENLGPSLVVSKRQRRPSVRLGDIGEQSAAAITYDAYVRKNKQWKMPGSGPLKESMAGKASSKTRPLLNLGNGDSQDAQEPDDKNPTGDLDSVVIGSWKKDLKAKRGMLAVGRGPMTTKRVRSNWVSRVEEGAENDEKSSGFHGDEEEEEEEDGGFREFVPEGSESPSKELSPIPSMENTDGRDWKCGTTSMERNGGNERRCPSLEDGVRMWLNGLGLGRYAPVFEFHEVDDDVLPLLTLEDLKDMGINAVGSRRKMFVKEIRGHLEDKEVQIVHICREASSQAYALAKGRNRAASSWLQDLLIMCQNFVGHHLGCRYVLIGMSGINIRWHAMDWLCILHFGCVLGLCYYLGGAYVQTCNGRLRNKLVGSCSP